MSMYAIHFSPTGGTKKVTDVLCEVLGRDHDIDLTQHDMDFSAHHFTSSDTCIISVPAYGGRVPSLALERLKQMHANGARAVLVAVYGNRAYDDTLLELKNKAVAAGYIVIAAIAANAEHSIMRQYGSLRPDAQDCEILAHYARTIKAMLSSDNASADCTVPGNTPYKERKNIALKPKASSACIQCGLCAAKCPAQAIPLDNPSQTDMEPCIACMRCIKVCPQRARHLNKVALFAASHAMKKAFATRKENEIHMGA